MPTRSAEVAAGRFAGWLERFAAGHGGDLALGTDDATGRPVLRAADGARALLDVAFAETTSWPDLGALVTHVETPRPYGLLLLRRGGWAIARCIGERVHDSRVGTRYVQGRTKKGGWSQQRYARRRANQAESVVTALVAAAPEVWAGRPVGPWPAVTGGDRLLLRTATDALAGAVPQLRVAARRLDVPDPRRAVLDVAARAACAVRVQVHDEPAA